VCVCVCARQKERQRENRRESVRQRERDREREIHGGESAQREIPASNAVVLAYARRTAGLAAASNAVVLAYAAVLVAYDFGRICISGECVFVRELCVCLCVSVCVCVCLSVCLSVSGL
jgi:hypothetical protein